MSDQEKPRDARYHYRPRPMRLSGYRDAVCV